MTSLVPPSCSPHSRLRSRRAPHAGASVPGPALTPLATVLAALLMGGAPDAHASGNWFAAQRGNVEGAARPAVRVPAVGTPQARAQTQQARRQMENLARSAQAIAAQNAAQDAARRAALAANGDIPDGLARGGLAVDTASATAGWAGALAPRQSTTSGRTEVVVEQVESKAILNWESFNVGRNTTVHFDQRAGTAASGANDWVVLNRINDPSGRPSRIAGQIRAEGAVYLVNRNGVIFHGSSQVNARNLVAASLKLSDEQFRKGINSPSNHDLGAGTGYAIPTFGEHAGEAISPFGTAPSFEPGAAPAPVEVEAGARLEAHAGGKIMLFAPKVLNAGGLAAPDGQVILAAGENIFLKTITSVSNEGTPNEVRGLDVAVSSPYPRNLTYYQLTGHFMSQPRAEIRERVLDVMDARAREVGYEVRNDGVVSAERGNITVHGLDVTQRGVLHASTALNNRNGSIHLRAWGQGMMSFADSTNEMRSWSSGTLTLGAGSVTQVLPDAGDTSEIEAAALATRYVPGSVRLYGKLVSFEGAATVRVPAGTIDVQASGNALGIQESARGLRDGSARGGRIYLADQAFLSTAGLQEVGVPMARNFVAVELRINELRDSPMQRDGWLRGQKLVVDRRVAGSHGAGPMSGVEWIMGDDGVAVPGAWVGTPLADVSGWVGVGKTDLAELSTRGGGISLVNAEGDIITRAGALLDVAGGSVRYGDGLNTASRLLGSDGRIHEIGAAPLDVSYIGLAGSYAVAHGRWGVTRRWFDPLQGGRALHEPGYLEGRAAGEIEIKAGAGLVLDGDIWAGRLPEGRTPGRVPVAGGTLTIGGGSFNDTSWSMSSLVLSAGERGLLPASFGIDTVLDKDRSDPLAKDEMGQTRPTKRTYLSDAMLNASGLGEMNLNVTRDVVMDADARLVLAPGAALNLRAVEGSSVDMKVDGQVRAPGGTLIVETRGGTLQMGARSVLDVSGSWLNDSQDGQRAEATAIDGGTIALLQLSVEGGDLRVEAGARLDVSGGGQVRVGSRGRAALTAGDAGVLRVGQLDALSGLQGLDLRAYAAGEGGVLALGIGANVQLGGDPSGAGPGTVVLPASLYGDRGFHTLDVAGFGDGTITLPAGVQLTHRRVAVNVEDGGYASLPTGAAITEAGGLTTGRPDQQLAWAPGGLSLSAQRVEIGEGALLRLAPRASLDLGSMVESIDTLVLRGTLDAPAGRITVHARQTDMHAGASLLARGVALIHRDASGLRGGKVLPGGDITLYGELAMPRGALIDVSGAEGEIDAVRANGFTASRQTLRWPSDAGRIRISGVGTLEGTFLGQAGGPGAAGGGLEIGYAAPAGNGPAPIEQIKETLKWLDPDCYGLAGNGVCDYADWREALGVDYAPAFSWALPPGMTMILPLELESLLGGGSSHAMMISDRAAGAGPAPQPVNPVDYGLTPDVLDAFRDNVFYTDVLRDGLAAPGRPYALVLRPGALASGGFADLSVSSSQSAIQLDGVALSLGRSISLHGVVAGMNGTDSRLSAPMISLGLAAPDSTAPARAETGLAGRLSLDAQVIEVRGGVNRSGGARITGYAESRLRADAIRYVGTPLETALMDVDGTLQLAAGVVHADSGVQVEVRAGDAIQVTRAGAEGGAPLSAGSSLTLRAPVIEQNGVLRAPHGQIVLEASERLVLGPDSLTSVSGAGVHTLYGTLRNGEQWLDPTRQILDESNPLDGLLLAPPEKRILLQAPDVALAPRGRVDIAGGGDLQAWEFVPGPGGSHDVLARPGTYAILPQGPRYAPVPGTDSAEQLWLPGGPGLAAGWYTLLPARYALLPGAYAVRVAGDAPLGVAAAGGVARLADGSLVMAGRRGNGLDGSFAFQEQAWQIMPGAMVRAYTEYNEAGANDYFSSQAFKLTRYRQSGVNIVTPRLPRDGGSVVFDARQSLTLDGSLHSVAAPGGRGGLVDIAGSKIALVGAGQDAADLRADGFLLLDTGRLSNFGAGSLLVGGTRRGGELGLNVSVTATDLVVRNGTDSVLWGPEILLAASEQLNIEAGSQVEARGTLAADATDLVLLPQQAAQYDDGGTPGLPEDDTLLAPARDWGALLRVSNGAPSRVLREGVDSSGMGGWVRIGARARLAGGEALLIDATRRTDMAPSAILSARALTVSAGRVGFGGGEGLVLDADALAQLSDTRSLTLRSYTGFDFHQSVDLLAAGLHTVTFDGAGFAGHGGQTVSLRGARVTLANSTGATAPLGTGQGTLAVVADRLVLGEGTKTLSGFGEVLLQGEEDILGSGQGTLDAGSANVVLRAPVLVGEDAAAMSLRTAGKLVLAASEAVPVDGGGLGARLSLSGAQLHVDGRIVARGGAITLAASAGDLLLGDGALLDVRGMGKVFHDLVEYVDAGQISLTSVGGAVRLAAGSVADLSGDATGASAGTLAMVADQGVTLEGVLHAQAGLGGLGGALTLDIDRLPDYATLAQRLNDAGFSRARHLRVRDGDVRVDGLTQVRDFSLQADRGVIRVDGMIDARSPYGGKVRLVGGGGFAMTSAGSILAGATEAVGSGRVTLEAAGGRVDIAGGLVDVGGGDGGRVRISALRMPGNLDLAVDRLQLDVRGDRARVLEGLQRYETSDVDAARAQAVAEASAFGAQGGAIASRLGGASGFAIMPAIELASQGDLTLSSDWNLHADFPALRLGSLTLRAAGDLRLLGHLSDGFDLAGRDGALQGGESWDLSLVAGADLAAIDRLALRPAAALPAGSGSVVLGTPDTDPDASVDTGTGIHARTGTGDLFVRAGRDVTLAHKASVLYTAGRRDADATLGGVFTTARADAVYAIEGGNLDISAQGSISAQPSGQRFVEWLNRQGNVNKLLYFGTYDVGEGSYDENWNWVPALRPPEQSSWWVRHGAFQQGVGALGGGNVSVSAGADLVNLLVVQPTNMRLGGGLALGQAMTQHLRNGGAFEVEAGGAILGGQYYVARGAGRITAARTGVGHSVAVTVEDWPSRVHKLDLAPVLALGDATLSLRTAGDLVLQTVVDPLMVRYGPDGLGEITRHHGAKMNGYTARSALELVSTGGNVTLTNQADFIFRDVTLTTATTEQDFLIGDGGNLFPARLRVSALNGDLSLQGPLKMAPGVVNDLRIAVGGDLDFSTVLIDRLSRDAQRMGLKVPGIYMAYTPLALMPSPYAPTHEQGEHQLGPIDDILRNPIQPNDLAARNPDVLDLRDDMDASRVYAQGSITGLRMRANEQTWVRAGVDIRGIELLGRNLRATDVTLLEAGNDILHLRTDLNPYAVNDIEIQGPGLLVMAAGRDIYANALRVVTLGHHEAYDTNNRPVPGRKVNGLPEQGAGITLMAGLAGAADYAAFESAYLDPARVAAMPDYLTGTGPEGTRLPIYLSDLVQTRADGFAKTVRRGLVSYMETLTGERLAPMDAWARYQALPALAREAFLRQAFLLELRDAGRDQNEPGVDELPRNGGYNRGHAAVRTLFPGDAWRGDITANNLMVRTYLGGDINVFTPGGGLQVAALGAEVPAGFGLVTLASGHINVFARDDITINRSRLLSFVPEATRQGSDQILWSTRGDIDAGRGAKTVRVPSSPEVLTDEDANTVVRERADMSGSGIGTVGDGDVDMVAPEGTVNAGDAGIRVAGNLNIAALQVLNAANIEVQGESKGVPLAVVVDTGALTSASAASSSAASAAQESVQRQRREARRNLPSIISVQILGFGDAPAGEEARRPGERHSSAPPDGMMETLAAGKLSASARARLTEEEARQMGL